MWFQSDRITASIHFVNSWTPYFNPLAPIRFVLFSPPYRFAFFSILFVEFWQSIVVTAQLQSFQLLKRHILGDIPRREIYLWRRTMKDVFWETYLERSLQRYISKVRLASYVVLVASCVVWWPKCHSAEKPRLKGTLHYNINLGSKASLYPPENQFIL